MNELTLRENICEVGRLLWERGFVGATDGNISVRLGEGRFLCTPSNTSKGFMRPEQILVADAKGDKVAGEGRVTSEFFTHLAAYEERPDIGAVVHAHPAAATALTLVAIETTAPIVPEVIMGLVAIPVCGYATPGSREGADVIRQYIRDFDAVLLDRHGAVTVAATVFEAYLKLEKVEHTARTLHYAYTLGTPKRLEPKHIAKLLRGGGGHEGKWETYPF